MRIANKTHWQTKHLRAFVTRCAKVELTPEKQRAAVVEFRYTRSAGSSHSSGWARIGGLRAIVCLSKHTPDKVDLAHVITHELAHLRGMQHPAMRDDPHYRRVGRWREIYAWAEALPLEVTPVKRKAAPTTDAKLEHCRKMLARNETKLKRITTIVKKWRLKVRYYERRGLQIAAAKGEQK